MTYSEKYVRVPGVIEMSGRWVKRYHISAPDGQIPDGIQDAAYDFLPRLLPKPDAQTPPEAPKLPDYLADTLPEGSTEGRSSGHGSLDM